jgi:sulfite exporter TauE/SafE
MVCGAFLVLLGLAMAAQKKITSLNVLMPLIQEPLDFRIV